MNAIKDSIKSGRVVVGTTVTPNVDVSILADAGYDFLLFDTQHSAWEIKQLQPSIQTMRGKQAAPLVRVAANQAYQICFALDAGARGIVVPMVNTSAEAEAAVRACRYFPLGNRSNAAMRGIAAGMYFIPPEMDPNFFVQRGFKFFTMPWGPWAKAGIQNGLSGIKR